MSRRKGRLRKLTGGRTEKILTAIRAGNTIATAAAWADVAPKTVYRWYSEGGIVDAPPELREFHRAVNEARAAAEMRMVAAVLKDARGGELVKRVTRRLRDGTVETEETFTSPNGRVALEWLARARAAQWGRQGTVEVEVSGPGGGPISVEHQAGTAEQIADRLQAFLSERTAEGDDVDAENAVDGAVERRAIVAGEVVDDDQPPPRP